MVSRIAVFAFLAAASPAWACGILQQADPKVGSSVRSFAQPITLTFSQPIMAGESDVALLDPTGKPVATGTAVGGEGTTLSLVPPAALPAGRYTVHWRARWRDCDSRTEGRYPLRLQPER